MLRVTVESLRAFLGLMPKNFGSKPILFVVLLSTIFSQNILADIVVEGKKPQQLKTSLDQLTASGGGPSVGSTSVGRGGGTGGNDEIVVVAKKKKRKECVEQKMMDVPGAGNTGSSDPNAQIVVVAMHHGQITGDDLQTMKDKFEKANEKDQMCVAVEMSQEETQFLLDGSAINLATQQKQPESTIREVSALSQVAKSTMMSGGRVFGAESMEARKAYFAAEAANPSNANASQILSALDQRDVAMANNIGSMLNSGCSQVVAFVGAQHAVSSPQGKAYRPNHLTALLKKQYKVAVSTGYFAGKDCQP